MPNQHYEGWKIATRGLTQGPRMKSEATVQLENLAHALLREPLETIFCERNVVGELEINVKHILYNVTQIFKHQPDFEHLHFTEKDLNTYATFLTQGQAKHTPTLPDVSGIPDNEDYNKRDKSELHTHLHYAEKLAITLYTSDFYKKIQQFLRIQTDKNEFKKINTKHFSQPENRAFLEDFKEIILATCVAAHGLAKPQSVDKNTIEELYRAEADSPATKNRSDDIKNKKLTRAPGFTSTTSNLDDVVSTVRNAKLLAFLQPLNGIAKNVQALSEKPHEQEKVMGPGSQVKYFHNNEVGFVGIPVRALDDILPLQAYSKLTRYRHDLTLMQDYLCGIYRENKKALAKDLETQPLLLIAVGHVGECLHDLQTKYKTQESMSKAFSHLVNDLIEIRSQMNGKNKAVIESLSAVIKRVDTLASQEIVQYARTLDTGNLLKGLGMQKQKTDDLPQRNNLLPPIRPRKA